MTQTHPLYGYTLFKNEARHRRILQRTRADGELEYYSGWDFENRRGTWSPDRNDAISYSPGRSVENMLRAFPTATAVLL